MRSIAQRVKQGISDLILNDLFGREVWFTTTRWHFIASYIYSHRCSRREVFVALGSIPDFPAQTDERKQS